MKKIIFILLISNLNSMYSICANCNKIKQYAVKTLAGGSKSENSNLLPQVRIITKQPNVNVTIRPNFKIKPEITNLTNATALIFGSTSHGLLTTTLSNSSTYIVGTSNANGSTDFAIAKYTSSGALDNSFGTRGIVLTDILPVISPASGANGSTDIPTSIALQTNGSLLVAGKSNADSTATTTFSKSNFVIARYLTSGRLDTTFGTRGVAITDIGLTLLGSPGGSTDEIVIMALQTNGSIVVAGNSNSNQFGLNSSFAVARYTNRGQLDTSFAQGAGVAIFTLSTIFNPSAVTASTDILTGMTVLNNGKIILTGFSNANNANYDFAAIRLNSNGVLDTSFGTRGLVLTTIPTT